MAARDSTARVLVYTGEAAGDLEQAVEAQRRSRVRDVAARGSR